MKFDAGNARKPIRELRKSLKNLPGDPPPNAVHNLRTRSRRIEALVIALTNGDAKTSRQVLKTLKPIRKAAGKVRDMDVLTTKVLTLAGHGCDRSLRRLLEQLMMMRGDRAGELTHALTEEKKKVRSRLKRFSRTIEDKSAQETPQAGAATRLAEELSQWPAFDTENLHQFRVKVKELRYVLQLAEGADGQFMKALDRAKQQIGDWHDWQQLRNLAVEILVKASDRSALALIAEKEKMKFDRALRSAHDLRSRYLGAHSPHNLTES